MNWDAISAIAELLGSIAVLATLLYLAIQTRSINRQSQAEARYAFVDAMSEINTVIAQSKETASVWRRGLESIECLDEDERMQFLMLVGQYANLWSVMHQLHLDRLLPETQWFIVRNDMVSILKSNGGQYFWKMGGGKAFDSAFSEFVNTELASKEISYDMAKMAK